jgi:hypothetical protein
LPRLPYTSIGGRALPVLAVWSDPNVPFIGLVDSGCDASSLSLQIALALGVSFDPNVLVDGMGAGGGHKMFRASQDVVLECAVGSIHIPTPTINPYLPFILLGRADLFAQYLIGFNQREQWFSIDPYPPPALPPPAP